MTRYYDPKTETEVLTGIHETENTTNIDDMPEESKEWFKRPAKPGYKWKTDKTGKYPVEVLITPPTNEEQKNRERQWAKRELSQTDSILLPDSPYTTEEREQIQTYRAALRNPNREKAAGFPSSSWRPTFPNVKHPGA